MPYARKLETSDVTGDDQVSVAIIGLACRFPGDASNPAKFWDFLCNARSAYSEAPSNRFNVDGFHSSQKDKVNTMKPRGGHFLRQDVAAFDANFFSISQSEAIAMDPQQRFMLEIAYEAFENAGLPLDSIAGTNTGCYMGNFTSDYREMLFRDADSAPLYAITGSGAELISNRVSWFYDLKGPSFTLNTACSSSLVALHQACQSIRSGESSMALVGSSNLLLSPDNFALLSNQNFLGPSGRCLSFDAAGDGYGRGEGFAALVVKNFSDAVRDGDPIRAVIRGTGVNSDGKTKGLTVPSASAQAELIRSTYSLAGLDFKDTDYVETHGTGTKAGDPNELEGIANTFGSARAHGNPLLVGSVKSNIGHLESTAGLAGLIKGIYILEQGLIPANINFNVPNPSIPFNKWKITVPTKLIPWPSKGRRRLSVQSFGYGGTNAHAILDDAYHYLLGKRVRGAHYTQTSALKGLSLASIPSQQNHYVPAQSMKNTSNAGGPTPSKLRLYTLSAQDKDGLKRQRDNLAEYLNGRPKEAAQTEQIHLRDLAYTLAEKRSRLAWRVCLSASSKDDLTAKLQNGSLDRSAVRPSKVPRIGFIFTGQGAQWARMGMDLLHYRIFRESIEDADRFLRSSLGCPWSAIEELCRADSSSNIDLPAYSQPLCTILQIALVDLLESWNIEPSVMTGHSSGEIAGAYCLGALTREAAWKVAYFRGLLSSQMKSFHPPIKGAMLAVGASEDEAEDWISQHFGGEVVVACVNSPSSVTLSGNTSGINDMEEMLKKAGLFARKLKVDTAYHSPHMEMISVAYLESISDIQTKPGHENRKMYSAVTGALADAGELGPINWIRNLVSPVLFYDSVRELLQPTQEGRQDTEVAVDILLEIGPHGALRGPINQTMKRHDIKGVNCYSVLTRGQNAIETVLAMAGTLYTHGVPVDLTRVNNDIDDRFASVGRPLVDIPSYCWNHTRTYWAESRISKQYRFREQPRLSLIGAPCSTYGEHEQLWRGFLRLSEEPWVRDHRIQTSILYPAAGYLAMALEGAQQMAAAGRIIQNFRMKDIQIVAPAVVTENSDMEFILQIRPHYSGTRDDSSVWKEFTVSTCNNAQDLRKNCYGLLLIEYQPTGDTGMSFEMKLEEEKAKELYEESARRCQTLQDPRSFYTDLALLGLNYGPTFQNISQIRSRNGNSCCDVVVSDAGLSRSSKEHYRPHIIHPSTLDAMFHAVFAAFKNQKGELKEAMVPKSIDEIVVSANIPFKAGTLFKGFSTASKHGFRELMGDLTMLDEDLNKVAVTMKKFHCTAISGTGETEEARQETNAGKLYSQPLWKPALEFCSAAEKARLVNSALPATLSVESSELVKRSEILALYYIRRAVKRIPVDKIPTPRLKELWDWMQLQLRESSAAKAEDSVPIVNGENARESEESLFQADVESGSIEGKALCQIGKCLGQILLGKIDAGELLRESGLLDRVFVELRGMNNCLQKISKFVDIMAHNNPDISVLELGISTQSATSSILSAFSEKDNFGLQKFDYAFATPNKVALEKAEEHLKTWGNRIKFKSLDISKTPSDKEIKLGSYDVVIVSDLLLAAQDPNNVLANLKKLLKPGGKLCLVHVVDPCIELALVLRCLPSWGYAETQGLHLGLMNRETLKPLLEQNDFSIDFTVPDFEKADFRELSVTTATADMARSGISNGVTNGTSNGVLNGVSHESELTIILPANASDQVQAVASRLSVELEHGATKTQTTTWDSKAPALNTPSHISLLELDQPFLRGLEEEDYASIRNLILHSTNLLWVTALDDPAAALSSGMFRSIRNEVPGRQFRTLSLQPTSLEAPNRVCGLIGRLAMSSTPDNEFREEDGILKICRFVEDTVMNDQISNLLVEGRETVDLTSLAEVQTPQKLAIRTQGMLDSLCLEADDEYMKDLGDDEIEVDVKATSLNFRDVMVAMGQIPDSLLGFEASGIVRRCGKNVSQFKPGEKVCTLGHGAHRTLFRNKASFSKHIPKGLSFEEASTLPLVICTAFHSLMNVARVRKGQSILIHAAAGGVGQSAIQLANYIGLEIFATVGSEDKKKLIQETYGVKPDHIFNSRDLSFAKGVMRMTNGRGVDCVLNSLSGEALRQSWQCIAAFGTFVEIGIKDILSNTGLEMRPFLQDASFTFFNLKHVMTDNPVLLAEIMEGAFDLIRRRIIKPVSPINLYPISDIENAFRLLQTGKHRGKIAITWGAEDVVPVLRRKNVRLGLNQNATYLLLGGLGGLGRSLARLLVDSGARFICFISRSGATSDSAQKLIQELQNCNVQVAAYSCDIANAVSLESTIKDCTSSMPPIRGVFQCAMVLQDALFERMSYSQWTNSLTPKVQGTWNLHNLLQHDLDFFIALSSFAAVFGNRSQTNYAAAGAYQDALAHYRRSQGLKAVSVDLGVMRDVGIIAEKGATDYLKEWEVPFGMRESEFHALMKTIIAGTREGSEKTTISIPAQVTHGLFNASAMQAASVRTPFYYSDPRFALFARSSDQSSSSASNGAEANGAPSLRSQLNQCASLAEAGQAVTDALVARVAKSLQTDKAEIDEGRPLHSYGIDSLVGVEIANWVFRETKVGVSVFDILATVSIKNFSRGVAEKSGFFVQKDGEEKGSGA